MKTQKILITTLIVFIPLGLLIYFLFFRKTSWKKFWDKVLYGVISREYGNNTPCNNFSGSGCIGKRYTDVLSHDGGTIGIAHWASGGLCKLYKNMDTQKYFGRSESEMCDNWASRYSGANSQQWWIDGFVDFVNSPESEAIQDKTFIESRQSAVDSAIEEGGWTTDREMAIAVGFSNSYGNSGFRTRANNFNWNPEDILDWYGQQSSHKNNRKIQIDKWFPKNRQKKMV